MKAALAIAIMFAGFAVVGTLDYHAAVSLAQERSGYVLAER